MKIPRVSIAGLMVAVALVAANCAAVRAFGGPGDLFDLLTFGALPMMNLVAVGLIVFVKMDPEGEPRRSLGVSLIFGLMAVILSILAATLATRAIHEGVGHAVSGLFHLPPGLLFAAAASVLLVLPQVAMAGLGGWLSRRYDVRVSVVVERRNPPATEGTKRPHWTIAPGV